MGFFVVTLIGRRIYSTIQIVSMMQMTRKTVDFLKLMISFGQKLNSHDTTFLPPSLFIFFLFTFFLVFSSLFSFPKFLTHFLTDKFCFDVRQFLLFSYYKKALISRLGFLQFQMLVFDKFSILWGRGLGESHSNLLL